MPGYSGTPLPKKLGIKDGFRVRLQNAPADVRAELKAELAGCKIQRDDKDPIDFAMIFTKSQADLDRELKKLSRQLAPAGMLWVSWPKKSSGVATDLDDNVVRETGLAAGLVDVKVCAVTDVWSGLKFVRRLKDR
jgi:alkylation response protein AidB-like acyl-CoA dehydrogenase